jgi:hypothetical protein
VDIGSFEACNRIIELVLAKDAYVTPKCVSGKNLLLKSKILTASAS